jgi:hypothetical protein
MIYAWDNYPVNQFPGLWTWMAAQIGEKKLVMPSVAFDEVVNKTPDCGEWLKDNDLELLEVSNAIARDAMRIKGLLGIVDDKYHAKGVGENDIFIIATAHIHSAELVSNEGRQKLADIPAKRKIPAVCAMAAVSVSCINFIEYIKSYGEVFR